MPVNIVGSKYAGTLTSASNALQIQDSSAAFNAADFDKQRIVGLWTSAGVYKGVAWIRRHLSNGAIELKAPFIDDAGNVVTQSAGDKYYVSKNSQDSVTAGLTYSQGLVTITDNISFGTSNVSDSVCFYDEDIVFRANIPNASKLVFEFRGGLCVFGHLQHYVDRSFSNPCSLICESGGSSAVQIKTTNQGAKVWWMGGSIISPSLSYLFGGSGATPAEWQKWWGIATNCDVVSPGDGANWAANPQKQEVVNINSAVNGQYAICLRWGDGKIESGKFKLSGSIALSIFGSDSSGTYTIAAPAGRFIEISEVGHGSVPVLWRSGNVVTQTINYYNVVTPNRKHGLFTTPGTSPHNSATGTFYFLGLYTGLINGTLAIVSKAGLGSGVVNSTAVSNGTATLTVTERTVVGHTETIVENTWRYGFWAYGYDPVSEAFSTQMLDYGAAGTAPKVAFGKPIAQLPDLDISRSNLSTVLAYTTVNTLDRLYDLGQAWKVNSVSNATYPSLDTRLISSNSSELSSSFTTVIIDSTFTGSLTVNTSTNALGLKTSTLTAGTKQRFWRNNGASFEFRQAGTFSVFRFQSNIIKVAASTSFVGSTFASSTVDNLSSSPVTITVDESQLGNITIANPTTGGGAITLQSPPKTLRFYGIPNVANAILRVQDLTANTVTFPTLTNGEATINVVEGRSYRIRAKAPGYLASPFITVVGGAVTEYQFSLTNYRSIYDAGVNRSSSLVFDPTTLTITINDDQTSYSFEDVFRTLEDYLSSPEGLLFTAHPYPIVIPGTKLLWFPFDAAANTPNPVRVRPDSTNTADPTLDFEVYLEAASDPTYDLFDFTQAGGRIIRLRAKVAIAQGGGAVDAQTLRDALARNLSAGVVPAANSIDAQLAAAKDQASISALNTQR